MHKDIGAALKNVTTLLDVKKELVKLFEITRKQKSILKIGYVAGIINTDGSEYIEINRKKLANHTKQLRTLHGFPIFSAIDVFSTEVYNRLLEQELSFEEREKIFRGFWREILKSGHVTDIFMTPRWEKSKGATDEHKIARKVGLTVHYIKHENQVAIDRENSLW